MIAIGALAKYQDLQDERWWCTVSGEGSPLFFVILTAGCCKHSTHVGWARKVVATVVPPWSFPPDPKAPVPAMPAFFARSHVPVPLCVPSDATWELIEAVAFHAVTWWRFAGRPRYVHTPTLFRADDAHSAIEFSRKLEVPHGSEARA